MTYENSFWQRLHNYPINKQALKEILDIKDSDFRNDDPKKGYWDDLPMNTCTDVNEWTENQKQIMGQKFGDVVVVGRVKRPPRKVVFYLSIIRKYGDHFTKNLEDFQEDWKIFRKNYGANRKPTYVFKCVCGRYTKFKIFTVKNLPRELQVCSHCVFRKVNRRDANVMEYIAKKKEEALKRKG